MSHHLHPGNTKQQTPGAHRGILPPTAYSASHGPASPPSQRRTHLSRSQDLGLSSPIKAVVCVGVGGTFALASEEPLTAAYPPLCEVSAAPFDAATAAGLSMFCIGSAPFTSDASPYHVTTATPRMPERQLKARATLPRVVNLPRVLAELVSLRGTRVGGEQRSQTASAAVWTDRCRVGVGFCYSPCRERIRGTVLPSEVEEVDRVAGGVAGHGDSTGRAGIEVLLRERDCLLQLEGRLDHCRDQTGRDVPLDVAVEQPDTLIMGENTNALVSRHFCADRTRGVVVKVKEGGRMFGNSPGLSALKRMTMLPVGSRTSVSRRIGIAGKLDDEGFSSSKVPTSASER